VTAPVARQGSAVLVAAVLGVSLFGGTASAYWRTTGTGTGTATTGTMTVTVDAVPGTAVTSAQTTTSGTLVPGGSATALLRLSNSSTFDVVVTGITPGSSVVVGDCPAGTVTLTPPASYTAASFRLAKGTSTTLELTGALSMSSSAPQACMGQVFAVPVTVTVQSA